MVFPAAGGLHERQCRSLSCGWWKQPAWRICCGLYSMNKNFRCGFHPGPSSLLQILAIFESGPKVRSTSIYSQWNFIPARRWHYPEITNAISKDGCQHTAADEAKQPFPREKLKVMAAHPNSFSRSSAKIEIKGIIAITMTNEKKSMKKM